MYRIVYMSKSCHPMADKELDEIRLTASRNNRNCNVSGLLVYADDTFFQVLEGPRLEVERVYDIVFQDDRHHRARILQQRDVADRRFADWTMGFCRITESEENADAFFDLSRHGFEAQIPDGASEDLVRLMEGFASTKLKSAEPALLH